MNGASLARTRSSAFPTDWTVHWWEAALLLGSGVAAVVLHRSLDFLHGLPGHHGVEWMALLILGRTASRFRGAGSLAGIGASLASMLPVGRGGDPFAPLLYLLPGPVMDAAFRYAPRLISTAWFLILLGGIAHITRPLARLIISAGSGWVFGSFHWGVAWPLASHFLFGAAGGLLGALIALGLKTAGRNAD